MAAGVDPAAVDRGRLGLYQTLEKTDRPTLLCLPSDHVQAPVKGVVSSSFILSVETSSFWHFYSL